MYLQAGLRFETPGAVLSPAQTLMLTALYLLFAPCAPASCLPGGSRSPVYVRVFQLTLSQAFINTAREIYRKIQEGVFDVSNEVSG